MGQRLLRSLSAFCPPLRSKRAHFVMLRPIENETREQAERQKTQLTTGKTWRRGSESNRRIKVLQTSPLPLGYRALQLPKFSLTSGNSPSDGKALAGAGLGPEFWSGRRDLNPRLRPWQGRTLPLSYSRSFCSCERPSRRSGFRQQAPAC